MPPQLAPSADGLPKWAEQILDRVIAQLQNETLRKKIQLLIIQPFLQYLLELIFPYLILVCVVFGVMILLMVSSLGFLVYKVSGAAVGSVGASVPG